MKMAAALFKCHCCCAQISLSEDRVIETIPYISVYFITVA